MATAVDPVPRKRRSSERDRDPDTRKRRKESKTERSKHSRSSRNHSKQSKPTSKTTPPGLRVRSVTELAALVASGAIRVPKGLQHYVSDRTELLDQVFTILSPADVKGMLPDVLKGLKMRKVKQLCLVKLQSMSEDDVHSAVQSDDPTLETNLNNTLMQLLGHPIPSEDKTKSGVVSESKVDGASFSKSAKVDENTETRNVDIVKKDDDSIKESEAAGSHLTGSHLTGGEDKPVDVEEKEFVICISDVSDDECSGKKNRSKSKRDKETRISTNRTESSVYVGPQYSNQPSQEHSLGSDRPSRSQKLTPDLSNRSGSSVESSDSDKDEDGEDVSEAAQFLEMEMRRRALESALKRVNDPIIDQSSQSLDYELINEIDNDSRQSGGLPRVELLDVPVSRTEVIGLEKNVERPKKISCESEHSTEKNDSHSLTIQGQTEGGEEKTVNHVVALMDQEQSTECLASESNALNSVGLLIEKRLREKLLHSLSKRK